MSGASETQVVDVRDTEPRFRFDMIMGTYEDLLPGTTMEVAVDHDPTCFYYTLKGTRGDEAFTFEYLERGPECWRVRVTKLLEDARTPQAVRT